MGAIIILWLALCFVVAAIGSSRNIGFIGAFIVALIFSPLVGFIVVALSDKYKYTTPPFAPSISQTEELIKLYDLKQKGAITDEEYEIAKKKLL